MWTRKRAILLIVFVLVAMLGTYLIKNRSIDVTISQSVVQNLVNTKLPLTVRKVGSVYTVHTANIHFDNPNLIILETDIDMDLPVLSKKITGHVVASGSPIYVDGAFYLSDVDIKEFKVDTSMISDDEKAKIMGGLSKLKNMATKFHVINPDNELISERLRQISLEILHSALEKHPVYRLNDGNAKQAVAHLALKDVRVIDKDNIVITLDPLAAIGRIVLYILIGLLCIAGAIGSLYAWSV